jgi:hypothetical protein
MAEEIRQFTVKTAEDRLSTIWSEKSIAPKIIELLDQVIQSNLKQHGKPLR